MEKTGNNGGNNNSQIQPTATPSTNVDTEESAKLKETKELIDNPIFTRTTPYLHDPLETDMYWIVNDKNISQKDRWYRS